MSRNARAEKQKARCDTTSNRFDSPIDFELRFAAGRKAQTGSLMLIVLVSRAGLAAPQADVIDAIHSARSRLSRGAGCAMAL